MHFYAMQSAYQKVEIFIKISFIQKKNLLLDPMNIPEVKCFLQGAINHGLTWSQYNTDVLSDGTYAANTGGYQILKTDIQTRCQNENFKRQFLPVLRKMYEDEEEKK